MDAFQRVFYVINVDGRRFGPFTCSGDGVRIEEHILKLFEANQNPRITESPQFGLLLPRLSGSYVLIMSYPESAGDVLVYAVDRLTFTDPKRRMISKNDIRAYLTTFVGDVARHDLTLYSPEQDVESINDEFQNGSILILKPTMANSIPECAEEASPSSGSVRDVSAVQVQENFQDQVQPLKKLEESELQNALCTRNHDEYLPKERQIEDGHKVTGDDENGVARELVEPQSESSTTSSASSNSHRHLMEQNSSRLVVPEIPKKPLERMVVPEFTKKPKGMVMVVGGCQMSREDDASEKSTVHEAGSSGEEQSPYKHEERFPCAEDMDKLSHVIMQEGHRSCSEEAGYHEEQNYVCNPLHLAGGGFSPLLPHQHQSRKCTDDINLLPDKKLYVFPKMFVSKEIFPPESDLHGRDYMVLFSNEKLAASTDLVRTSDCRDLFPLPEAVQSLVPYKILRFTAEYTPTCHFSPLNRSLLLGHGGYGIVFRHLLNGQEYAVKWTAYCPAALKLMSTLHHENVIALLGVVKVTPGCYQLMDRMTGSLYNVACFKPGLFSCSDFWTSVINPNIKHILKCILCGLNFLHCNVKYQHSDLKEGNVLFYKREKCTCHCIACCICKAKCVIKIADFDSARSFAEGSIDYSATKMDPHAGTMYYRAPEVYRGAVQPSIDLWSLGVMICQILLGSSQVKYLKEDIREGTNVLKPHLVRQFSSITCVMEAQYGRELLSSVRGGCIENPQVKRLMNAAEECLHMCPRKRTTAYGLLCSDCFV